ncbi:MAG: phenylphosphate carboxylase subunit delta [Desulfobacteraceae bacterium 4572_130]|nr:MAG: phenylphosphate carboxylase subunit delta [Desulfobacteraceae bacterium 4572_130]
MLKKKLGQIKLLLLDVDGILTDGKITYTENGKEIKNFDSKDGLGLKLLMESGVKVGIITGRKSKALTARCKNLGINIIFDNIKNKIKALDTILKETGISTENTAFAGDDLPDLCVMKKVGLSITVSDACSDVIKEADIVIPQRGGKGAVRQICEDILKAKNLWSNIISGFL